MQASGPLNSLPFKCTSICLGSNSFSLFTLGEIDVWFWTSSRPSAIIVGGGGHLLDRSFGDLLTEARPHRGRLWDFLRLLIAFIVFFIWQHSQRKRGDSQGCLKKKKVISFLLVYLIRKPRWMNRQKTLAPSSAITVIKMWAGEKNSSVLIQTQGFLFSSKNNKDTFPSPISCLLSSLSPFWLLLFENKCSLQ